MAIDFSQLDPTTVPKRIRKRSDERLQFSHKGSLPREANRLPKRTRDVVRIVLAFGKDELFLSQDVLANTLGVSQRTASREIQILKDAGILTQTKEHRVFGKKPTAKEYKMSPVLLKALSAKRVLRRRTVWKSDQPLTTVVPGKARRCFFVPLKEVETPQQIWERQRATCCRQAPWYIRQETYEADQQFMEANTRGNS